MCKIMGAQGRERTLWGSRKTSKGKERSSCFHEGEHKVARVREKERKSSRWARAGGSADGRMFRL